MKRSIKEKRIFQTALGLFARFGYKKTTVEDVARELGMTPGNLYFYVASKKDLYEKAVGDALASWKDSVAESIKSEKNAADRFRTMAERSYRYLRDREDLRAILAGDPGIFAITPGEDRFGAVNRGAQKIIENILREGIDDGSFHPVRVKETAEFLFSAYMMFLIKSYVKNEGKKTEAVFREGLKLVIRGLRG